jgi:alkylation response protein AidB-like acyl-CoA dehydrogenase
MDFALSDEQSAIRDTVRTFITKEVMPLEEDLLRRERQGSPGLEQSTLRELQNKARAFGFWGLSTPEEYGGMALSALTQSLIWTEVGRCIVPFRFGGEADNILYCANDAQRAEYLVPTIEGDRHSCFALTEPGAGSDAANIGMRARRDGDDWVLRGEKTFITGGNVADFAIVIALTDPERGARDGGATALLVDREMGWTSSPIETMGPATPAALSFDDVRVPAANLLGEEGRGFHHLVDKLAQERLSIAAAGVAAARAALDWTVEYTQERHAFGQPISSFQNTQFVLAEVATEVEIGQTFIDSCVTALNAGTLSAERASMAKYWCTELQNRAVDRCLQLFGGYGYMLEYPIARAYADARITTIYGGTSEIMKGIIAKRHLGL